MSSPMVQALMGVATVSAMIALAVAIPYYATDKWWRSVPGVALKGFCFGCLVVLASWNTIKLYWYMGPEYAVAATSLTWNETRCSDPPEGDASFTGNETISSDPDGADLDNATVIDYWCHGIEGSISLAHWVPYRSGKISSPPMQFLAFHVIVGATACIMAAATLVAPRLRERWATPFFIFAFILGVHTIPVTLPPVIQDPFRNVCFFVFAVVEAIVAAFALFLLHSPWPQRKPYEPVSPSKRHARLLKVCWAVCGFLPTGAGMAEGVVLAMNAAFRVSNGYWPVPSTDRPGPVSGKTFYDRTSYQLFLALSLLFMAVVWGGGVVHELVAYCRHRTSRAAIPLR